MRLDQRDPISGVGGIPDPPPGPHGGGPASGTSKRTYLGATYQRIAARRGRKKPAIAVGRSILEIAYHVLRDGVAYEELGANYYDERQKESIARKAVQRLKRLGYKVTIEAA